MTELGSAAFPEVVEWTLRNPRTKEERQYEQTELTIEGESRLVALVQRVAANLTAEGFPWERLSDVFDPNTPTDWNLATSMLGIVASEMPEAVAESTCLFLGIYPSLEDGTRNPDFEGEKRFIRGAMTFSRWVDMVQVFAKQNDYQRLVSPFGRALATGAQMGSLNSPRPTPNEPSPEPSTSSSRRATAPRDASSEP